MVIIKTQLSKIGINKFKNDFYSQQIDQLSNN